MFVCLFACLFVCLLACLFISTIGVPIFFVVLPGKRKQKQKNM